MSEAIKHECGIVLIRLLKPLEYYQAKYGTWMYGLNKLYIMMEKQRNRGQDGAGVASLKIDSKPGQHYISRVRSNSASPIEDIFEQIKRPVHALEEKNPELIHDVPYVKDKIPFAGELFLGHLRYGTFGRNNIENVHPVMRENNWKTRALVLAGNFNLTNVDELFAKLIELGQHPKDFSDTVTIMEKVGHFIDDEVERLFRIYKNEGYTNFEITHLIANHIDLRQIMEESCKYWDGGYVIGGFLGHGDAFVMRDPWGIRPAFYYINDEIAVVASERAAIQTALNAPVNLIHELKPGNLFLIKRNGEIKIDAIRPAQTRKSCSFERIYFSRGSDQDIYKERKKLGELLTSAVLESIDNDLENTVFSFIPNTAETAFYGMLQGIEQHLIEYKQNAIVKANGKLSPEELLKIISLKPRVEKIAIKDVKLRTFITQDKERDDLVGHVYDITYGTIKAGTDNLVIIDDSIVRGTTLKQSILRILDRLEPRKIVIVSSSPQIRYPDCYGIDMAKLSDFVAFQAAIELLRENGKEEIINTVYKKAKEQQNLPKEQIVNYVKDIYRPFTAREISKKIAELLRPKNIGAEVEIVYQSIENLHKACPNDLGDWYFTGDYPTPGGNKVVNTSFINFIEGKNQRAY